MCYNACKKYLIISLLFISSAVKTMQLVNVPNDVLARIALPLVNNNHIPFAFHHPDIKIHTHKTLNLLYDNACCATFSYVSFTLTCKRIYEALSIKSCMPQTVDLYILVQWLDNFRNVTAKQMGWSLIHYYNVKEVQESFSVDITCWSRKANVNLQWVIKCLQTNQARHKDGIVCAMNGNKPLLEVTPFWKLVRRSIKYSARRDEVQLTHVKKISPDECSFTIAGSFNNMPGSVKLEPWVLYLVIKKIARQRYFDWVDDTNRELVIGFFKKYCVKPKLSNT